MTQAFPQSFSGMLRNPFLKHGLAILGLVAAVMVLFPGFVRGLFNASQFMPRRGLKPLPPRC
jgi:hypothetical protein